MVDSGNEMASGPPQRDNLKAEVAASYDEVQIPFDQVLRKLVSTRPAHKVAAGPVKRNAKKPPKKV